MSAVSVQTTRRDTRVALRRVETMERVEYQLVALLPLDKAHSPHRHAHAPVQHVAKRTEQLMVPPHSATATQLCALRDSVASYRSERLSVRAEAAVHVAAGGDDDSSDEWQ